VDAHSPPVGLLGDVVRHACTALPIWAVWPASASAVIDAMARASIALQTLVAAAPITKMYAKYSHEPSPPKNRLRNARGSAAHVRTNSSPTPTADFACRNLVVLKAARAPATTSQTVPAIQNPATVNR